MSRQKKTPRSAALRRPTSQDLTRPEGEESPMPRSARRHPRLPHGIQTGFQQTIRAVALAATVAGSAPHLAHAAEPAAQSEQGAQSYGTLEVTGDEQHASVRLKGTGAPTFTVFRLDGPSRVVVDLNRADVSALQQKGKIAGKGLLVSAAATQFDDPRAKVGRLVLTVKEGTKYDVKVDGNDLVVELRAGDAVSAPVASAPAAAPAPVVASASASAPSAAPASDDKVVRVEADSLPGDVKGGTQLLEARLTGKGKKALLALQADGPIARYKLVELKEPGRIALDLEGFQKGVHPKVTAAGPVAQLRIARHEDRVRVVLEGQGDRFPPFEIVRTAKGLEVRVGQEEQAPVARTEEKPAEKPAPKIAEQKPEQKAAPQLAAAAPAAPQPAEVKSLDVSGQGRVSRIVLLLDKELAGEIEKQADGSHVLSVKGAHLPKELARRLDASALEGPVASVASLPGQDGTVKVVVQLRAGEQDCFSKLTTTKVGPSTGLVWTFTSTGPRQVQLARADVGQKGPGGFMGEAPAYAMAAAPRAAAAYTGKRVDFTAKDLDIIQFLQAIGEVSKRNIVASDDVTGKVSVRLRNVPWDEALDIVLRTKGLDKQEIGNIIRVAPADKLRAEREAQAKDLETNEKLQPLKVRLIPVNYANAMDVSTKVKDILTQRGTVTVDDRTNVLIVKDVVDSLAKAELLVRNLDTQTPQVLIEARIVEAATSFSRSVGIQWGGDVKAASAFGNPTGLVFPNLVSIGGAATDGQTNSTGTSSTPNFAVNMPAAIGTNTGGGVGFIFGSAGGAANLNLRLSAAEVNGTIKTVSAPKVTTMDNQQATISQGTSIPFSQVSAAGVNTTFVEARLQLDVTPHVTADGAIMLKIVAANNQPNPQLTGANGQPSISRREANTKVLVKDGDTTVIGGIYTRRNSVETPEVPFFSKIPILGRLFKKETVTDDRTEMLIFITPRIVNRQQSVVAGGDNQ